MLGLGLWLGLGRAHLVSSSVSSAAAAPASGQASNAVGVCGAGDPPSVASLHVSTLTVKIACDLDETSFMFVAPVMRTRLPRRSACLRMYSKLQPRVHILYSACTISRHSKGM